MIETGERERERIPTVPARLVTRHALTSTGEGGCRWGFGAASHGPVGHKALPMLCNVALPHQKLSVTPLKKRCSVPASTRQHAMEACFVCAAK